MDLDTNNSNKSSNYGSSINNEDITEIEVKLDNVIIKELKIEQNQFFDSNKEERLRMEAIFKTYNEFLHKINYYESICLFCYYNN